MHFYGINYFKRKLNSKLGSYTNETLDKLVVKEVEGLKKRDLISNVLRTFP